MSSVSVDGTEQSRNDDNIDDGCVHSNRKFGNLKDEKTCKEEGIQIADLTKKLEANCRPLQISPQKQETVLQGSQDPRLGRKQIVSIDENAELEKTCNQQKLKIAELTKELEQSSHSKPSGLVKTYTQQRTDIDNLTKNLESQRAGKDEIIKCISSIERWTSGILKSKEECKKFSWTSTDDIPDVQNCKKKLRPVLDAFVDSTNNLSEMGLIDPGSEYQSRTAL